MISRGSGAAAFRLSCFGWLCAMAVGAAVPAAEEGGAEVVPLPEDAPGERQAPPKPPEEAKPARAKTVPPPAERSSETAKEPGAESVPLDEPREEPPERAPEQTAVIPPLEVRVSITEPDAQTAALPEPPQAPTQEPPKELAKNEEPTPKPTHTEAPIIPPEKKDEETTPPPADTVPLKESPKPPPEEPVKEVATSQEPRAKSQEPGAKTQEPKAESPAEPVAEAVPLPAAKLAGGQETLALTADSPVVLPGQAAVFSLYGPEPFLRGATGRYVLRDEFGRQLARGTVKVSALPFSEGKPRQLKVEVRNPLAQQHTLELALTGDAGSLGTDGKTVSLHCDLLVRRPEAWDNWIALVATPPAGEPSRAREQADRSLTVAAQNAAAGWATLRSLGIRGGMQYRLSSARREALRQSHVPFYVENVGGQKLLSRYHSERGLWEKTIAAMSADPNSRAPLMREPSFCSQAFAEDLAKELQLHAEAYGQDQPLFYSLASEPSVTRLAAAADFDFSPEALQEFQRWLERDVYGTLKALNASWDTQFAAWPEVVPMTTGEARLRLKDGVMSFGPWVDFRDFQDYMFSKVLRDSAEYARRFDPKAKVGITGALGPFAFGGWDWSRLAQALDVVEAYDIGGARALWRDLAPGKPALAALALWGEDTQAASAHAARAIWSLALEGGPRGIAIWDEEPLTPGPSPAGGEGKTRRALLDAEGKPTPLAQALAPLLKSLAGELGTLLAGSTRLHSGVAILYSPASVRLHWLFEAQRLHGDKWLAAWGADTGAERRESPQLRLRESWCKLLDDLGLGWRFVSSTQVENREILKPEAGINTIVLPRALALSDREATVLKQFVSNGGQLVADAACGRFDEHGRRRDKPALDDVFQVDTSTEPFAAQPLSPLERVQPERGSTLPPFLSAQNLRNLAPVFSDQPKWLGPQRPALEYRHSPVLAASGPQAVYLNLDLTDYLRWRLHPDQPRAQAVREVVGGVAFAARLAEGLIDRENTRLPAGTQLAWLQVRGVPSSRLLALRRNPQTRLHELGSETDSNAPFEKPEPFALVLRKPASIEPLAVSGEGMASTESGLRQRIEGTLDPLTPALFLVSPAVPSPLNVLVSGPARAGEDLEISIVGGGNAKVCLFSVHLFVPDGTERAYLAATKYITDGTLHHTVPLAFNEPAGTWKITVRDLANGGAATASVEVSAAVEGNR